MGGQSGQFIPTLPGPAAQIGRKYVNYANLNLVHTEVVLLLGFAPRAQRDFLLWAEPGLDIDTDSIGDLPQMRARLASLRPAIQAWASRFALILAFG